jgi:LysM repeat protein
MTMSPSSIDWRCTSIYTGIMGNLSGGNACTRNVSVIVLVAICLSVLAGVPTAGAQSQTVHVVQTGENVSSIALRYGTTVEAIAQANGLFDPDSIQIGQRLVIPSPGSVAAIGPAMTAGGTYVVQSGDTLGGIAFRYGLGPWALLQANGLRGPHELVLGQNLVIPAADGSLPETDPEVAEIYVVQQGDTLRGIAERFETSSFAIASTNGMPDRAHLRVGQVLHLPRFLTNRRIVIDLSDQHLYAYEDDWLEYSFVCSSGRAPYYTRTGDFRVQSKIPNAYGSTWDIWMPNWLGIYWAGGTENGIHALPILANGQTLWAGYLGSPVSYGCIVVDTYDASLLYDWAEIGTRVSIVP